MKKSLKIGIIICVVIVIILLVVLAVLNKKPEENVNNQVNNVVQQPIVTTKKIAKYVDIINKDYYMKYKTNTKDNNGEPVTITAEYAVSNDRISLNYQEYLTTTLITKECTYYIMHESKSIVKYPIDEKSQQGFSGFQRGYTQQLFETNFLGTGTEDIEGVAYYYEEYKDNATEGNKIRYYFDENDSIKYIKNITSSSEELTEILQLNNEIKEELFELPKGYTEYDINDLTNTAGQ